MWRWFVNCIRESKWRTSTPQSTINQLPRNLVWYHPPLLGCTTLAFGPSFIRLIIIIIIIMCFVCDDNDDRINGGSAASFYIRFFFFFFAVQRRCAWNNLIAHVSIRIEIDQSANCFFFLFFLFAFDGLCCCCCSTIDDLRFQAQDQFDYITTNSKSQCPHFAREALKQSYTFTQSTHAHTHTLNAQRFILFNWNGNGINCRLQAQISQNLWCCWRTHGACRMLQSVREAGRRILPVRGSDWFSF